MSRRNFSHLLQKYLDGRCSKGETELVESWFSLLDDEECWQQLSKEDLRHVEQKLWVRLQHSIQPAGVAATKPSSKIFRLSPVLRVAAVLLLLLVSGAVVYTLIKSSPEQTAPFFAANWNKKVNDGTKPLQVLLEDGSRVELTGGATLYFPQHFESNKREVKIEGTAFFKIAKDSFRPFYVHSQDIVTRVLGTSFWVIYDKARQQSAVEVVTGKVAVYKQAADKKKVQAEGVLLKPNEKVIFNKQDEVLITALVDTPVPVNTDSLQNETAKNAFNYEETPLIQVIAAMESEYGITIILGDEKLSTLQFTGNISSLDYYTKLKTICKSLGAAYEVKGNRILIQKR